MNNTITDQQALEQQAFEANYIKKKRFSKFFNQFDMGLAVQIGLKEAIFLQKLHQLLSHEKNTREVEGFRWYYNTFDTWHKEYFPCWSKNTITRIVYKLRGEERDKNGRLKKKQIPAILITTDEHNKMKYYKDHTLWYRINYVELHKLLTKSGDITQVKATHGGLSMSTHNGYSMSTQSGLSSTNMNPTKNPPLEKRGGGFALTSNHEDSAATTFDSVGELSGGGAVTGSVEEPELYGPLSQANLYEICKSLLVSPEDVMSVSEEVITMFHAGELKVIKNTKQTTIDFLKSRIAKGSIVPDSSDEMMMAIESEHPLDVARTKYVLLEMKLAQVNEDGKSLAVMLKEGSDENLLLKKEELGVKFKELKPKWKQAMNEFNSLGKVYPDRFTRLLGK